MERPMRESAKIIDEGERRVEWNGASTHSATEQHEMLSAEQETTTPNISKPDKCVNVQFQIWYTKSRV